MIVPFGERDYYALAPEHRDPAGPNAGRTAALDLDGFFGLHPRLAPLKPLWDARQLAIVHACGSPDGTRSHFDAQDYMETATPGVKSTQDGWLNRYLHAREHAERDAVPRRRARAAAAALAAGHRAGAGDRTDRAVRHPRRPGDRHGAGVVRIRVRRRRRQGVLQQDRAARRSTRCKMLQARRTRRVRSRRTAPTIRAPATATRSGRSRS